jgi:hypothetical protein
MMLSTGVFCGSGDTVLMVSNARPSRPLPLPYNVSVVVCILMNYVDRTCSNCWDSCLANSTA